MENVDKGQRLWKSMATKDISLKSFCRSKVYSPSAKLLFVQICRSNKCDVIINWQTTSSESTSTTSCGSSSSNSSSSGSESSSSDSESSSSSANSQKVSDTERTKKKTPFPAGHHGKTKVDAVSAPSSENKNKEKVLPKSRPVEYSSESEESPSKVKSAKRKPPAKPKATATVAPVVKQQRPPVKSAVTCGQQKNTPNSKPIGNKSNKPTGKTIFIYNDFYVTLSSLLMYHFF